MFSVLVLLEDSKNVWSDHLRQKMANPAAKNRFFRFRHAVGGGDHDHDDGVMIVMVAIFLQDCALWGICSARNKNQGHFYTQWVAVNLCNIGDPLLIRKGIMLSPKISISKPGIYSLPMGERKKLTDLASDHHLCVAAPPSSSPPPPPPPSPSNTIILYRHVHHHSTTVPCVGSLSHNPLYYDNNQL